MDNHHRDASGTQPLQPLGVMQRGHLHTAAAISLDTVAGTGDDQHGLGLRIASNGNVHRQGFVVAPRQRVVVRGDGQTSGCRGLQKPDAGLGVTGGERLIEADHLCDAGASCASQASASRTQ